MKEKEKKEKKLRKKKKICDQFPYIKNTVSQNIIQNEKNVVTDDSISSEYNTQVFN